MNTHLRSNTEITTHQKRGKKEQKEPKKKKKRDKQARKPMEFF